MANKQVLFHQIKNGKWKFKCACGSDGRDAHFKDKKEAELAHAIHWMGCDKRFEE